MSILWILIAIVAIGLIWVWGGYNRLVKLKNQSEEAWSDIDVQLKRRYDLIPNLVSTVKGYASHEQSVFENVTKARTAAMGATGFAEKGQAENMLSQTLKSLFAVSENYPTLKADQNFAKLQDELSDTENKIQASRRFYNGNVRDLNTAIEQFPTNMLAGWFKFIKREFFELEEDQKAAAKEPVEVKF
ncbi:MAG: LemA family protein [Patescibacteria group bacterium]